VINSLI